MSMELDGTDEACWTELQCVLRTQLKPYGLNGCTLSKSLQQHKSRLVEIVKRTSLMGESNSALVIGPRGSGKSALIEAVVEELYYIKSVKSNLIHIKLSGLVHTDDNISLKDIVRQLQLEEIENKAIGSFAEKLTFLLDALKTGSKQNKSILFILDEFDMFTLHKDQTLLYNLFDVAQSQQSPICVVGVSCRADILSKLENRVRSRFSHQLIYLYDRLKFTEYVDIAKEILSLPNTFSNARFRNNWNKNVSMVIDSGGVQEILKKYFDFSCSIRDLKRYLLYPVSNVSPSDCHLKAGDFMDAFTFYSRDAKCSMLQGLSILEVSLVIAMMHLTELYEGDPFNFEMVYHEYKKFLQKKMSMQNLDKAVVMKAFEHLMAAELVKEVSESSKKTLKRYVPIRLMVEPSQVREAITRYPNLPFQLQQWATSMLEG